MCAGQVSIYLKITQLCLSITKYKKIRGLIADFKFSGAHKVVARTTKLQLACLIVSLF
jgi:hypothetical protein